MNLYGYLPGSISLRSMNCLPSSSKSRAEFHPTSRPATCTREAVPLGWLRVTGTGRLPERTSTVALRTECSLGWHGRRPVSSAWASSSGMPSTQYMYPMATPGARPMPAVQWMYMGPLARSTSLRMQAMAAGRRSLRSWGSKSVMGMRRCRTSPRCPARRMMGRTSRSKYAMSRSCCRQTTVPTPSSSLKRSRSAGVCRQEPTKSSGVMRWKFIPASCRYVSAVPMACCMLCE
mmetsp:Transcript_7165/g.20313  ORF Transcript_7165/g.20313 Transcript_7165/m.20313 type:complete len:233 (+) Transcript_7165:224-922(+)